MSMRNWTVVWLSLTLILPLALVEPVRGENPQWQVGDSWAVGVEKDLAADFDDKLAELKTNATQEEDIDSVDYDVEGKAGYFADYAVVDSGDPDLVKVISNRGLYIHLALKVTVGLDHYQVGNFTNVKEQCNDGCQYDLNREQLTMTLSGGLDVALKATSEALYTKQALDLKELDTEIVLGVSGAFGFKNVPREDQGEESDYDWENNTSTYEWVNIEHESGQLSGEASLHLLTEMEFDPAMKIYDFPLTANSEWNSTTNLTAKVSFWGELDAPQPTGMDQPELDELLATVDEQFEELNWTRSVTRWSDLFPLTIPSAWMRLEEQLPEEANLKVENGRFVLEPQTLENVTLPFHTGEAVEFTTPSGDKVTGIPILPGELEEARGRGYNDPKADESESGSPLEGLAGLVNTYYDPDGQAVGAQVDLSEVGGEELRLESEPVLPAEAGAKLDRVDPTQPRSGGVNAQGYDTTVNPTGVDDTDAIDNPLPGPALLGVLAVVVASALTRRRRTFR